MNLKERIEESLKANPKVVIVEYDDYWKKSGVSLEPLRQEFAIIGGRYIVAPKVGLYSVKELQNFMIDLIPDMSPSVYNFRSKRFGGLEVGHLDFKEKVCDLVMTTNKSAYKTNSNITDEEMMEACRKIGVYDIEQGSVEKRERIPINRIIKVNVYPDEELAKKYKDWPYAEIGGRELRKSRKKHKKGIIFPSNMYRSE